MFGKVDKYFHVGTNRVYGFLFHRNTLVLCFMLGFFVRLAPEVLAFPYPIGWDSLYYAGRTEGGVVLAHWSSIFSSTWLLYAILVPMHTLLKVEPFLVVKIVGPILFGLNVAGVYWLAKSLLGWDMKKSFLAAGFFAVQLASLRISWDLLRNTLGLGLLLFALPLTTKLESKRVLAAFAFLSLLTVFAHEYAAVTLLVVASILAFRPLVKERHWEVKINKRLILGVLPALMVFLIGLYLRMYPVRYASPPGSKVDVIRVTDTSHQSYGKLFFLTNYLGLYYGPQIYPTYLDLLFQASALFALLYLAYIFLVWKGFFRNNTLDVWTGLLLVGSFGCLLVPFCALDLWHRWMFMLAYPFTFYAVNGVNRLLNSPMKIELGLKRLKPPRKKVYGMILSTVLLGGVYLASPVLMVTVGVGIFSLVPICRYFSSSPAVPYQVVDGLVQAMQWLKDNMENTSCVVLHLSFVQWAKIYLDGSHNVIGYNNDIQGALNLALEHGFNDVYFVCWNENIRWYGLKVPEYYIPKEKFGNISVYTFYNSTFTGEKSD
jgi:hypothetical protein